ncbi:hypothetical protein NDU88_003495 [Pleurodeles waltl]|uniref:Uncharacterized protein n=1 Tax=Pleurodeles waltl TaxID=8319 RepID=A0AAV7NJE6_PLEWA|nr:hypothetical protein NDU88_003495 [Pleurodeles waltl]
MVPALYLLQRPTENGPHYDKERGIRYPSLTYQSILAPAREACSTRPGTGKRVSKVEAHASSFQNRDQELLFLRSKLTDLEDRSRRDNVRLVGFPENMEGEDLHRFLQDTLPSLTGITFEPPLEFQRAHRLGLQRTGMGARPQPIIACLLRHTLARQLIQRACTQGALQLDGHTIRMSADFSMETNDRRRAFLAFRPRLRQLEVKYGLFEPVRMWVTKNGTSKDFYDLEDLRSFLLLSPAPGDGTWRDSFTATTTGDRCYMQWWSTRRWQTETNPTPP